jgi:hypothetical protein
VSRAFRAVRQWNSQSSTLECIGDLRVATQLTALQEAINQNTPGNSQGLPEGLTWDKGDYGTTTLTPAPSGFSAVTGWGQVYQEAGASVSPNAATDTVQIADYTTYVHLTNGSWVEVQNQAQGGIGGAHYVADFANNANIPLKEQTLSDGSVSLDAPPAGYNDHFWPTSRGTYTPGTVDGVFVEANMKTNDPSANLVAQLGADWWRSSTATFVNGFGNNPAVGGDNLTKLTTQWQTLYYTSLSAAQLQADPPPGLATGSTSTTPPATSTTPPGTGASGGATPPKVTTPPGTGASGGVTPPKVTTPPGTGASGGVTPPKIPVLSVADHSLSVSPGHGVSLGIGVTVPNKGDAVTVHVAGLPKYETITDNLDHKTFSGSSISLTAAEANSGLTLSSQYRGQGDPTAALTVTATDSTGKPVTSAAQTITVKDPPATAGGSWPSSGGHHDHDHSFALLSQSLAGGSQGRADLGQIAMAASHASSWLNEALLTRPQH